MTISFTAVSIYKGYASNFASAMQGWYLIIHPTAQTVLAQWKNGRKTWCSLWHVPTGNTNHSSSQQTVTEHDVLYDTSHHRQKMFYFNAKMVIEQSALYSTPLHTHTVEMATKHEVLYDTSHCTYKQLVQWMDTGNVAKQTLFQLQAHC